MVGKVILTGRKPFPIAANVGESKICREPAISRIKSRRQHHEVTHIQYDGPNSFNHARINSHDNSQIKQLSLQELYALLLEAVPACQTSVYSVHKRHSIGNPERKRRREEKVGIACSLTQPDAVEEWEKRCCV